VGERRESTTRVPEHDLVLGGETAAFDLALECVKGLAGIGRVPDQTSQLRGLDLYLQFFIGRFAIPKADKLIDDLVRDLCLSGCGLDQ
jgi:hypothetical protein